MIDTSTLQPGEIYVATIQIAGQAPYHILLLSGHPEDVMTHQAATEWAASIGGELPSRNEQALLFANQRDQFARDLHWSKTLHEFDSDYAWYQDFTNGTQYYGHCRNRLRARAVRREYF